jgi:hypothetical protein
MSLAIPSPSVSVPAPLDPKRDWITPEDQLNRLISPIATEISESTPLFPDLAKVVAQYMVEGDWYTALQRLKSSLPEKITIPPLPSKIYDILQSKSPIHSGQGDKDTPSVIDTHRLSLVLEEFGCLDNLERNILSSYVQQAYPGENDPLHFQYFTSPHRVQYLAAAFPKTHWILTSVLPGSGNKTWDEQMRLLKFQRDTTLVNYEKASLQHIFVANSTYTVATGKVLFSSDLFMRIQETSGELLSVCCHPHGVFCIDVIDFRLETAGIAVVRKL